MKVKMLHSMSGPEVTRAAGDIYDLSDAEALPLVKAGLAEVVSAEGDLEAAELEAPEKAVVRRALRKRG